MYLYFWSQLDWLDSEDKEKGEEEVEDEEKESRVKTQEDAFWNEAELLVSERARKLTLIAIGFRELFQVQAWEVHFWKMRQRLGVSLNIQHSSIKLTEPKWTSPIQFGSIL